MSTVNDQATVVPAVPSSTVLWQRRFFIVLTILGWIALAVVILWGIGKIITPLVLIGFSALLAYLIFPLVRFFERHMPRILAILISLLMVLAVTGLVVYFVVVAAIQQFGLLIGVIQNIFQHPEKYPQFQSFENQLGKIGLSSNQIHISGQQVLSYLQGPSVALSPLSAASSSR